MAGPTRFEINGERHYATDIEGKAYPSVTTILGKTASEHAKKMLSNWNAKNPGGKEKAAARGTAIHAACENYIRGLPINLPDEYLPFWVGLDKHLDKFDYFIWSEKPLKPEWNFCTGSDGISRLWSHQYGFCGCPDLIGYRNSLAILVDFKTSNQPYCRWFPDKKDPSTRQNFTGWSKLNKCALQLAAYGQAAQETLDVRIDCAQILVSTPEIDQSFLFHGDDLTKYKTKWLQKVRRYRELKAEESQALEEGQ
tara:strand:- start:93 stop:851 length:759 start_codon:yes stop_codon:yes gene_type:complete